MIDKLRYIVKKYFSNFAYFYRHLRYRIFVILGLSIMVGVMDGFGLAMFLPLLEFVAGGETATPNQMGNLSFLIDGLEKLSIELNLTWVLLTMLGFFTCKGLFKYYEQYKNIIYKQFFIRNLREEHIISLANFDYKAFISLDAGRIQNTMSGEIQRVSSSLKYYLKVIHFSVLVIVYSALAFLANAEFAILVLIGGFLTNLLFSKLYSATKHYSRKVTYYNHQFQGLLIQLVSSFKYLKATGSIHNFVNKLIRSVYDIENSVRRIGILNALMVGIREPLMIGVVVIVVLIQVNLFSANLGLILLSILFFYRALNSVMSLQEYWNNFLSVSGSLENLQNYTRQLEQNQEVTGSEKISQFKSEIRLSNLNFQFGEKQILGNINLDIKKNETIAIVGESGSGKTTLMNLICGILKPNRGKITIDGIDYSDLNITTFQNRIGYITQEPIIFNDTIYNNVSFWEEKNIENQKRFNRALNLATIKDFVNTLPDKEDTILGNNGINLSGGQKQRISIARELYKDVDLLLMDEATSSLDSETEREIQVNIEHLKGKYTIIIIAHRLSTIKNVDRVVYMNNGCIEDIGGYHELIKSSSAFNDMVKLQEI